MNKDKDQKPTPVDPDKNEPMEKKSPQVPFDPAKYLRNISEGQKLPKKDDYTIIHESDDV